MWPLLRFSTGHGDNALPPGHPQLAPLRARRTHGSWAIRIGLLLPLVGLHLGTETAHAQNATWLLNPGSTDWNTTGNWAPVSVPTGTATFGASNTTTITFSKSAAVGTLDFDARAPAYSFDITGLTFSIHGTGIVNHSSNAPSFAVSNLVPSTTAVLEFTGGSTAGNASIANFLGGTTHFFNTSTAGNATITTVNNTNPQFGEEGATQFSDSSTAGNAKFVNNGVTQFFNASTAGNATFTNDFGAAQFFGNSTAGTAHISNGDLGVAVFGYSSTAGNATIINNSGGFIGFYAISTAGHAVISNYSGGVMQFSNSSTAGNATINNNGGRLSFYDGTNAGTATIVNRGGLTQFTNSSSAANATLTDLGGTTTFGNRSTAGNATITTHGFALVQFEDASSAANSTLTTNKTGVTNFEETSTAANSILINYGNTDFFDTSTAGNSTITNEVHGLTQFFNRSSARNAKIANFSGTINFFDTSTASKAIITNYGGATQFYASSTAGNSIITNNGSTHTTFFNTSTAGSSTITNFSGGITHFFDTSTAGQAAILDTADPANSQLPEGATQFSNSSTAGHAKIMNNGGVAQFFDTSTAGNAFITTSLGATQFFASSTAGNASLANGVMGATEFANTSTAGNAKINNLGFLGFYTRSNAGTATFNNSALMQFSNSSTAGHATILNQSGSLAFYDTTKADTATILNQGGFTQFTGLSTAANSIISNSAGGDLKFFNSSKAGAATIINNGGITQFFDNSTAGNSAITTNSGGETAFFDTSTGSRARFITKAGGIFDISGLISGGTMVGSIEGAGTYQLGSNTLTVGLNNLSTKVGGVIADGGIDGGSGGALIKVGTGTLTLTGLNTYSGGTILNAGTLTVGSSQALGLGNVTVNGGIFRADSQPIHVRGDYLQKGGGTLQLQVAGAGPGQYEFLNVGGNAALGGTLQLISLGFQPKAGNQLTLVTTGGVVSSRFTKFVDPFAAGSGFNSVQLVYERNSVLLQFLNLATSFQPLLTTVHFGSFALTPKQAAAAKVLDAVQLAPQAADLISFLDQESFANLPADFERFSPEALTAFYEVSFSNANIQRLNLEGRLDEIRNGSSGFNSNMAVNGATVNLEDRTDADGKSSKAVVEPILRHAPENLWGVWVTGFGDFVSVDAEGNAKGYDFTTGGVSLGIDYRITDQLAIGVMGDYSHTWTSLQPSGHIDVDSGRGGLYATWYHHGIYLNGAVYGGHNTYDSGRASLGGLATGGTEGAEWSTFISGGYDFHVGQLTVGPIAALQYTDVEVDGFSEKGSLAPLDIHSGSAESLRSDVGFRLFYQWQIGKIVLEPSVRATWEHEYKYSALPITAGFAGIPGPSATFFGPSEGHDSAVVSAGVSVQWTPSVTTYVNYDGQLGRDNYDSNAVTGGVRISF